MDYSKYFRVVDYYEKFVIPLNPRRYKVQSDKMMVCPLHDDHDPSLGIIPSKKEGETFHCFGCNAWGSIVELHQGVCKRLLHKYITEEESLKDLCRIMNVDYDKIPKEDLSTDLNKGVRQEVALGQALEKFDIQDFQYMLMEGKMKNKGINYFNTITMIMLNEVKENR